MDCCNLPEISSEPNCPACGSPGKSVRIKTTKHWIVTRLVPYIPEVSFYFCKNRGCQVFYFSADGSVRYTAKEIRYPAGIKEASRPVTLCYCFGITEDMIRRELHETGKSSFSTWLAREVKVDNCACDVRNPSGRCCLKDVRTAEAGAGNKNLGVQRGGR